MKTMKFLTYATFVLFLGFAVSSCSGDDGADGATGPAGTAGTNGTDGADGADGNANVQTFIFNNPTWVTNASHMKLYISELTQDVFNNAAVLGYIKINYSSYYSIPGATPDNFFRVYMDLGLYTITAEDFNGNNDTTPPTVEKVKVLIIESTNTTTTDGNGRGVSPQQVIYNELAEANVDVNDYYAVCAYYGINPE
jgi:hypothetical protein